MKRFHDFQLYIQFSFAAILDFEPHFHIVNYWALWETFLDHVVRSLFSGSHGRTGQFVAKEVSFRLK